MFDPLNRRQLLCRSGLGFRALALGELFSKTGLLGNSAAAATSTSPMTAKASPLPAKAKHVIHIFLNGGCSHVDTFDPKPELAKYAGKPIPSHKPTERKPRGDALAVQVSKVRRERDRSQRDFFERR
ncbi:MAG: DUF1501 domain-containing protein [Pirellulales bacterium]